MLILHILLYGAAVMLGLYILHEAIDDFRDSADRLPDEEVLRRLEESLGYREPRR